MNDYPKTFDPAATGGMMEHFDGKWVQTEDYNALRTKLARAQNELTLIKERLRELAN